VARREPSGLPDLREANLAEAILDGANLSRAKLQRANLRGAALNGANLRSADLREAKLQRANLSGAQLGRAYLSEANLSGANLRGANLWGADLREANLSEVNLWRAELREVNLSGADLRRANLSAVGFSEANLSGANLREAHLSAANLSRANLWRANLSGAELSQANLSRADLTGAGFSGADLRGADLYGTTLVETDLSGADLTGCRIYGISAWGVKLDGAKQQDLIITPWDELDVAVDNIEVAQFVYLLLHNQKIRDVIDTIGKKGVLLLGRFTEGRIEILEQLRAKLRELGFVPIVFKFDKPETKDFTETVRLLANLSHFVIVDITNPRSAPLELQALVPDYMVPFVPILEKGQPPFAMFVDLQNKYDWVLPAIVYPSVDRLIEVLKDEIIGPAQAKFDRLLERRANELRTKNV
jgi:uncharacterized protein YjbI with pentapeptide repeats